jgi:hypothetical protein
VSIQIHNKRSPIKTEEITHGINKRRLEISGQEKMGDQLDIQEAR